MENGKCIGISPHEVRQRSDWDDAGIKKEISRSMITVIENGEGAMLETVGDAGYGEEANKLFTFLLY